MARKAWLFALLLPIALAAAACGSDPTATPTPTPPTGTTAPGAESDFQAELAQLIAAAQAEGKLVIDADGGAGRTHGAIIEEFGKQFGIEVTFSTQSDPAERIVIERDAGRFLVDVTMLSSTPPDQILIPAGALRPIEPLLFFPDVIDMNNWFMGRLHFHDSEGKYNLAHSGSLTKSVHDMFYNTDLIGDQIGELTSLWQFAREPYVPWIDKMVAEPAFSGNAGQWSTLYAHPDLGEEFVRGVLLNPNFNWVTEDRLIVDGVAQGKYAMTFISSGSANSDMIGLAGLGLPIAHFEGLLQETGSLSMGGSTRSMQLVANPPNPNAQKLFINWWLSRDTVLLRHEMQLEGLRPSLRIDVPIVDELQVRPGIGGIVPTDPDFVARRERGRVFVQQLSQCVEVQGIEACRSLTIDYDDVPPPPPSGGGDAAAEGVVYTLEEFNIEDGKFRPKMGEVSYWGYPAGERVESDVTEGVFTINLGDSIVFEEGFHSSGSRSTSVHNFTITGLGIDIPIQAGERDKFPGFTIKPKEPGEYIIFCSVHPDGHGNNIKLIVVG